jgi:hypothetical protein
MGAADGIFSFRSRYEITWPFFQFRYGSLCRSAHFSGHVIFFTTAYFPPKPGSSSSAGKNGLLYLQKFFHATGFCFLIPAGEEGFRSLSGDLV